MSRGSSMGRAITYVYFYVDVSRSCKYAQNVATTYRLQWATRNLACRDKSINFRSRSQMILYSVRWNNTIHKSFVVTVDDTDVYQVITYAVKAGLHCHFSGKNYLCLSFVCPNWTATFGLRLATILVPLYSIWFAIGYYPSAIVQYISKLLW